MTAKKPVTALKDVLINFKALNEDELFQMSESANTRLS